MRQLKYITLYNALIHFINLSRKDYFAIEERLVVKRLENKEYLLKKGEII